MTMSTWAQGRVGVVEVPRDKASVRNVVVAVLEDVGRRQRQLRNQADATQSGFRPAEHRRGPAQGDVHVDGAAHNAMQRYRLPADHRVLHLGVAERATYALQKSHVGSIGMVLRLGRRPPAQRSPA